MYKTALAALSLALSFGLLTAAVSAQDQNQSGQNSGQNNNNNNGQGSSGSNSNSSSGSNNSGNSNSSDNTGNSTTTNSTTSGGSGSTSSTKPVTTTSTAATPAKPATPAAAPVYVQTYGKYATPTKSSTTVTSTGAQQSTSTTTKTASIGKTSTTSTTTATTATTTTAKKTKDETVVLQDSGKTKYVSTKKNQWQNIETYINLKPGQESLPLTMTVTNEGYTGINMLLAGSKLATDKDFKGNTLRMQMTGALAPGDNKLVVQAFGPVGANLSWKLTTLKPVIVSIKPAAGSLEDDITLTGRNFSKLASSNVVTVGTKVAVVKSATTKEIVFNLPKDTPSGKSQIIVSVGGIQSKGIDFSIKFAPEVTGVDILSAPPGQSFTITGKGFSPVQSENVVTIGGVPAPIISCNAKSITATVPEMYFPQWHLPIIVKVGGIESKPGVQVNIQSRVIPNDGVPEQ